MLHTYALRFALSKIDLTEERERFILSSCVYKDMNVK